MCLTWGSQCDGERFGFSKLTTATGNLSGDPSPEPFMRVLLNTYSSWYRHWISYDHAMILGDRRTKHPIRAFRSPANVVSIPKGVILRDVRTSSEARISLSRWQGEIWPAGTQACTFSSIGMRPSIFPSVTILSRRRWRSNESSPAPGGATTRFGKQGKKQPTVLAPNTEHYHSVAGLSQCSPEHSIGWIGRAFLFHET